PRIKMQLYKTEPCQSWTVYGMCRYGDQCKFAHGFCEQRARLRHPKYKTSICKDYALGKCTFGSRCNFAHSLDELRAPLPDSPASADSAHHWQRTMLVQTPVGVLPDGRTMSTFTPVPAPADPVAVHGDARLLRRYQSAGALRVPNASAAPAPPAAAAASAPRWWALASHARHPPCDSAPSAFASPVQPLLHLCRAQSSIARRVASLSQLPSLRRSAGPPAASPMLSAVAAVGAAPPSGSPLAYESPILAPPSPGEAMLHGPAQPADSWLDEHSLWSPPRRTLTASTSMQTLPRINALAVSPPSPSELDAAVFGRSARDPVFAPDTRAAGPSFLRAPPGRALTSSISMQMLPRFAAPVPWDAPATPAGSAGPQQLLHPASAQSSATLIDSDVWSTAGCPKPHDSRFFPSDAAAAAAPRAAPAPSLAAHRALRRQQSTDDWVLLRHSDTYAAPSNLYH
ncbi:hypothetical protein IWQ56_003304, partial [Coemansia nantahalensis]